MLDNSLSILQSIIFILISSHLFPALPDFPHSDTESEEEKEEKDENAISKITEELADTKV